MGVQKWKYAGLAANHAIAVTFISADRFQGSLISNVGMKVVHTSGYSGTPLAKKLGIKQASRMFLVDTPDASSSLF